LKDITQAVDFLGFWESRIIFLIFLSFPENFTTMQHTKKVLVEEKQKVNLDKSGS